MNAAEPVYLELIDFLVDSAAGRTTPDALLEFRPSGANQARVAELLGRREDGTLSAEETSELDDFVQIEHLMIMAKARARSRLQLVGGN